MLCLPDEVLFIILENLYCVENNLDTYGQKHDLLSTRAVCRRLANLGQDLSFKHITFIQDEHGYKNLLELSKSPFAKGVQRLDCYFETLETEAALTVEDFTAWLKYTPVDFNEYTSLELNHYFKEYRHRRQYQDSLEDGNLDIASLAAAMHQFPKLRSVRILQAWSFEGRDIYEDGSLAAFPVRERPVKISQHWSNPWFSGDAYDLNYYAASPVGERFFGAIMSALRVSQARIEDLILGSFNYDSPALASIIQSLAPKRLRLYEQVLGTLKHLKILLPGILHEENEGLNFDGISALIRSAPLLQELWLSFDAINIGVLPVNFLGSLGLPPIRTLGLGWAKFRDPSCLVDFLGNYAITLKRVELGYLVLETGSWETVFIGMRENLTLDSISLSGDFRRGEDDDEEQVEISTELRVLVHDRELFNYAAIGDFVRRSTNINPFDWLRSVRASHDSLTDFEKCRDGHCLSRNLTCPKLKFIMENEVFERAAYRIWLTRGLGLEHEPGVLDLF